MLMFIYQIFSSLLGHFHFFVHFFFTFMENFFMVHPILNHSASHSGLKLYEIDAFNS